MPQRYVKNAVKDVRLRTLQVALLHIYSYHLSACGRYNQKASSILLLWHNFSATKLNSGTA